MKIRIKGNSIRYRLTKTEIDNFGKNGLLEEETEFLNGPSFHYRLEKKAGIENMEASFFGNRICIFVPENMATEWTTTDIVGYDYKMKIGEGKELFLLIEKDFVCIDHTFEDQSDNYPNPNKACPT
jgi:predicted nucleotidyltransferase